MVWSLQKTTALTESEFEQWNRLLEEKTGILLSAQQQAFLQTQIAMRMRELGFTEYAEYYRKVTEGIWGKAEWSVLVDRLMIKETSFFRHEHSYQCVQRLLQERINNQSINESYDVWSVGCSTGEESYSLAMLINDVFERANLKPFYGIFATDISMPALSKARAGLYYERRLEKLSENDRKRYFEKASDDRYKIINKIQERVCFSQGSVLDKSMMPNEKMDLIFCQNVLIYFRQWRRRQIVQNLVDHLKPGGVLVLGLGEMRGWKHSELARIDDKNVQVYKKLILLEKISAETENIETLSEDKII